MQAFVSRGRRTPLAGVPPRLLKERPVSCRGEAWACVCMPGKRQRRASYRRSSGRPRRWQTNDRCACSPSLSQSLGPPSSLTNRAQNARRERASILLARRRKATAAAQKRSADCTLKSARRHPQRPLNEEASTDSDAVCVRLRAIISPPAWSTHTPTQDGSARTVSGPSAESRSWGTAYAALLSHAV